MKEMVIRQILLERNRVGEYCGLIDEGETLVSFEMGPSGRMQVTVVKYVQPSNNSNFSTNSDSISTTVSKSISRGKRSKVSSNTGD